MFADCVELDVVIAFLDDTGNVCCQTEVGGVKCDVYMLACVIPSSHGPAVPLFYIISTSLDAYRVELGLTRYKHLRELAGLKTLPRYAMTDRGMSIVSPMFRVFCGGKTIQEVLTDLWVLLRRDGNLLAWPYYIHIFCSKHTCDAIKRKVSIVKCTSTKQRRYLERFALDNYYLVRDARDVPEMIATIRLLQWLAQCSHFSNAQLSHGFLDSELRSEFSVDESVNDFAAVEERVQRVPVDVDVDIDDVDPTGVDGEDQLSMATASGRSTECFETSPFTNNPGFRISVATVPGGTRYRIVVQVPQRSDPITLYTEQVVGDGDDVRTMTLANPVFSQVVGQYLKERVHAFAPTFAKPAVGSTISVNGAIRPAALSTVHINTTTAHHTSNITWQDRLLVDLNTSNLVESQINQTKNVNVFNRQKLSKTRLRLDELCAHLARTMPLLILRAEVLRTQARSAELKRAARTGDQHAGITSAPIGEDTWCRDSRRMKPPPPSTHKALALRYCAYLGEKRDTVAGTYRAIGLSQPTLGKARSKAEMSATTYNKLSAWLDTQSARGQPISSPAPPPLPPLPSQPPSQPPSSQTPPPQQHHSQPEVNYITSSTNIPRLPSTDTPVKTEPAVSMENTSSRTATRMGQAAFAYCPEHQCNFDTRGAMEAHEAIYDDCVVLLAHKPHAWGK